MNKVLLSTGKDDWETPIDFFKKLDNEFHFTLDPCCIHETAKCAKYFTLAEDGLK
nr:MAG TPA: DNA N-6-adenine-methyltransferase [Caudoviricetes sp.]